MLALLPPPRLVRPPLLSETVPFPCASTAVFGLLNTMPLITQYGQATKFSICVATCLTCASCFLLRLGLPEARRRWARETLPFHRDFTAVLRAFHKTVPFIAVCPSSCLRQLPSIAACPSSCLRQVPSIAAWLSISLPRLAAGVDLSCGGAAPPFLALPRPRCQILQGLHSWWCCSRSATKEMPNAV